MAGPTVVSRLPFGREKRVTAGADGIEVRGGRRDRDVAFKDVSRLRFSRTWLGFDRCHLRWTIEGTTPRMTVSLDAGSAASPETAAFGLFVEACLDRVAPIRPDVEVILGMTRPGWCLWLGTFGIAVAGLIGAIATMVEDGSLLAPVPAVLALLAGLPACWRNLVEGWAKRVSVQDARAALASLK